MHFDWTINIATVLSAIWLLIAIPLIKFMGTISTNVNKLMFWLKEYPPHIHMRGEIRFPRGMRPERSESLQDVNITEDHGE